MSDINISIPSGEKKRLLTGGKYCPDDIVVEVEEVDTDVAFEAGREAEYDAFWDAFQQFGKRTDYSNSFGAIWDDNTFKPKYDMKPTSGYMMFRSTNITDLRNLPVKLDFSRANNAQYMFQWANIKYIGVIDVRNVTTELSGMFAYMQSLISIDKIIFKEDGTQKIDASMFASASSLTELTIEGCIGKSLNLQWSKLLTRDSIMSVINALSSTTSGLTLTLSQTAVSNAFETSAGVADGVTSAEWLALTATKSNWNIALA